MHMSHTRSFAVYRGRVRRWWNEPVDYAAQVAYFAKRSTSHAIRVAIGLSLGLNGGTSLVVLLPAVAPEKVAARTAVALFAALTFVWAYVWCFRPWPSRRMSIGFAASCDIGIALMVLHDPNWLTGFFAFNTFGLIAMHLLFFDGPKIIAAHAGWVLVSTTAFAVAISPDAHVGAGILIAQLLAITGPAMAAIMGIHLEIWDLRNDANNALSDPLTGLLNRRGLHLHLDDLLFDNTTSATEVAVMVADLDRFKQINDTYGHSVGDAVLIRTAQRITAAVRGRALVARTGGEEFVIVDLTEPGGAESVAERIRYAVAAPAAHPTTASVGLSCCARADLLGSSDDLDRRLDAVIARADRALFNAKRLGGNATISTSPVDGHH